MKKYIILFIITLSLPGFSQNPKAIVEKCVQTLGGEEAVKRFSDYQAKGEMKIFFRGMELTGKLKMIEKSNKSWLRTDIVFGQSTFIMIRAYDGKSAWMERMGNVVDQPSLNYESDLDHTISLLLQKNAVFSFVKETEIEGEKAIGVEVDFKGKKTTFFINRQDNTILEIVYKDIYFGEKNTKEMLEKRIRYQDYRKIDGVLFPTKMIIYQKGKRFLELNFNEISFNPQVAPAKFQRPDQKLDLRYTEERIH